MLTVGSGSYYPAVTTIHAGPHTRRVGNILTKTCNLDQSIIKESSEPKMSCPGEGGSDLDMARTTCDPVGPGRNSVPAGRWQGTEGPHKTPLQDAKHGGWCSGAVQCWATHSSVCYFPPSPATPHTLENISNEPPMTSVDEPYFITPAFMFYLNITLLRLQ